MVDGTGSEEAQQTESQMQSIADATRTHVPLLRDRRAALVERQLACLRRRIRPWPLRPIARAPAKIVFHDKEGCGAAHGGERAAAERAQAAGERHERERRGEGDEGRDEKSGGEKEETNDGTASLSILAAWGAHSFSLKSNRHEATGDDSERARIAL